MPLSPEWQLLLSGAKTHPTREDVRRIHQAMEHPDFAWARLTQRACAHGIAPLLYHTWQQVGLTRVLPPTTLEVWQRVYSATTATHGLFSQALQQVLHAVQGLGTSVIVLKGAALAETVYRSPAVRPMRDVDLLVRAEDLSRIDGLLAQMGYRPPEGAPPKDWWRAQHYHWAFRKPETPPFDKPLEVHWHIDRPSRPFAIDLEGLWQRALPATIAGVATYILAPEDLLLHICLHTCRHASAPMQDGRLNLRLLSFCDLAEIIRHYTPHFDWASLTRRAQQWGVTPYVHLPLLLVRDLLGAAVPESVLTALEPKGFDARLRGWVRDELLEDQGSSPLFPDLLRLWRGGGLRDRIAIAEKVLAPAVIAKSYGLSPTSRKRYGYYPRRLKDLVCRYGPVLWQLLWHNPDLIAQVDRKTHLAAWLSPFNHTPQNRAKP